MQTSESMRGEQAQKPAGEVGDGADGGADEPDFPAKRAFYGEMVKGPTDDGTGEGVGDEAKGNAGKVETQAAEGADECALIEGGPGTVDEELAEHDDGQPLQDGVAGYADVDACVGTEESGGGSYAGEPGEIDEEWAVKANARSLGQFS